MFNLFAVSAPGLAPLTGQELEQLGLLSGPQATQPEENEQGGVAFEGDRRALYRANLHLRTASRILLRLGEFTAVGFTELRRRAAHLSWERCLTPGQPVALRVTCHKSRLYHSGAVAERVAGAIEDRLGKAPLLQPYDEQSEEASPQLIVVRLLHDHCTVSMDSSGSLLHRRGYRLATAKAPLRETLAAAMLLAAGWNPATAPVPPFLDPFCGSGTLPIEAAMLAYALAPGRARDFAFMAWPDFDAALWAELLAETDQLHAARQAKLAGRLTILASDRDAGAIAAAQANAQRAGVAGAITFACQALSAVAPPAGPGWVVSNPPYGLRVSANRDLRNLYAQLGKVLRSRCPGWQVTLLCSDRALLHQTGLPWSRTASLVNGGLKVLLAQGQVPG